MVKDNLFADRLKTARKGKTRKLKASGQHAYTQTRLGIDAGLPENTAGARISQYENGVHMPDMLMAARFAEALDVPLAYLFCEENDLADILLLFKWEEEERAALHNQLKAADLARQTRAPAS